MIERATDEEFNDAIDAVADLTDVDDLIGIETLFREMILDDELKCEIAAVTLRFTFSFRELFISWYPLLEHAKNLCVQQGLPLEHVLVGLTDER